MKLKYDNEGNIRDEAAELLDQEGEDNGTTRKAANDPNKITKNVLKKNVIEAAQLFHVAGPTRDKRALRVEDQEGHIAALIPVPSMIPNGEEAAKIIANLTSNAANLYSICDAIAKWNDRQDSQHALSKRLSRRLHTELHRALTG